MTSNRAAIIAGGLLAAFFLLSLVLFTVRSTEVAAVTTFGKPARTLTNAGLYAKWPWPIQRVYKFDARIQDFEGKFEETFTQDDKPIIIMVYTGWRIAKPIAFLQRVGTLDTARRNLEGLIRTYKNGVMGKHPFSHLVSLRPEELRFEEIEAEMLTAIKKEALDQYGIAVEFLGIKMLGLPESITQSVFERMRKERESVAVAHLAEGARQAADKMAEAEKDRETILASAEAAATKARGEADAAAAEHLKILKQNDNLAIFLRKLQSVEKTTKERTTLVLDPSSPPYDVLKSPGGGGQ